MIEAGRIQNYKTLIEDGYTVVLITRKWVQGVPWARNGQPGVHYWLPDAGPSPVMLDDWHNREISWTEFQIGYLEMQQNAATCRMAHFSAGNKIDKVYPCSPVETVLELSKEHARLALCCVEQDGEPCHRHLLMDLIDQHREASARWAETVLRKEINT